MPIILIDDNGLKNAISEAVRQIKAAQSGLMAEGIVVEPKYDVQFSADVVISANAVQRLSQRAEPELTETVEDAYTERTTNTGTQTSNTRQTSQATSTENQTSASNATDTSNISRQSSETSRSESSGSEESRNSNEQNTQQTDTQSDTTNSEQEQLRGSTVVTELEYVI